MKIAPIDITHKQFGKKMMGFDPDEVQLFLQAVAEELEATAKERNLLKEAVREKELQIVEYRERDKALRETIQTAQKMSERISQDAEREAKLIVNDAHQQADLIVKDARDSLKRIYQEISELKKLKIQFETNMRALLQAHISMMDSQDTYIPMPKVNAANEKLSPQVSPVRSGQGPDASA